MCYGKLLSSIVDYCEIILGGRKLLHFLSNYVCYVI